MSDFPAPPRGKSYGPPELLSQDDVEAKLIRRLERLAREWPSRDYMIASMGGTLCLFRSHDRMRRDAAGDDALDPEKALWTSSKIPNTGGDW